MHITDMLLCVTVSSRGCVVKVIDVHLEYLLFSSCWHQGIWSKLLVCQKISWAYLSKPSNWECTVLEGISFTICKLVLLY